MKLRVVIQVVGTTASAIVASISPATPPSLTDDTPAAAVIARHLVFS